MAYVQNMGDAGEDGSEGGGGNGGNAIPSEWARRRFGTAAGELAEAVVERLQQAHERALGAHLKARLKQRSPYGRTMLEAVREDLAEVAQDIGGEARHLGGFPYAVVNGHALFLYKYAARPTPLGRARMPQVSLTRRRLFYAHGPKPAEGLFSVNGSVSSGKYERLHEPFEELGRETRLVSVFFTADPDGGVHAVHWGDARLEQDRTFTWHHAEQLALPGR